MALSPVHNPSQTAIHNSVLENVHNPGLTSVHNPALTTVHNPSPPKQSPGHTTVHTPGHTVAPSCSENLLVEVQTEYPASLANIHKMKLGITSSSSQPTSANLQVADWSLRRNLSGSKSFDISLESSPSSTGSGVRRRGGMRRDSVGLSTSSTTSSSPASASSPGRWAAKAEELSSELEQEATVYPSSATQTSRAIRTSCSADHLGAIVDILGVPSSAPQLWDSPRRWEFHHEIISSKKTECKVDHFLYKYQHQVDLERREEEGGDEKKPCQCWKEQVSDQHQDDNVVLHHYVFIFSKLPPE